MDNEYIQEIIKSKSIPELIRKMGKFYSKGFDIDNIDKRIKNRIKDLEKEYANNNSNLEEIKRLNKNNT